MSEHDEQATVIQWARYQEIRHPELYWLHSSLNGIVIPAPPATRARIINHMKAEGMRKGIPDLFLPLARRGYHGLYIEMKTDKGKLTVEQKDFLAYAEAAGYLDLACFGADEAIDQLKWYIGINENRVE
jgi:hypothetical protein